MISVRQCRTLDESRFFGLLFFVFLHIVKTTSGRSYQGIMYLPEGHDTLRRRAIM